MPYIGGGPSELTDLITRITIENLHPALELINSQAGLMTSLSADLHQTTEQLAHARTQLLCLCHTVAALLVALRLRGALTRDDVENIARLVTELGGEAGNDGIAYILALIDQGLNIGATG